jgi:hypothetical protein
MKHIKKSNWKKYSKLKSSVDRVCYVTVCFKQYVCQAQIKPKSTILLKTSASPRICKMNPKFFFSNFEISKINEFRCVACHNRVSAKNTKWILQQHCLNTQSPICLSCSKIVF